MNHTPVSRTLVKMIRDMSKPPGSDVGTHAQPRSLQDNLHEIQERQNKEIEFYLRTCSTRLDRA